ncbi:proprotein convertase subtilisin/kexin type 5 [Takifugu rubripes]|uniref:proprotein convertase subtilisin/kexin type 5 n=1 Tax=Takifugu rubripes TaxID=31033 RepID=UPI001145B131|nr:proprotein convertase subtilisin/kexin type 5-like [Takifugu rubripes]
MEFSLLRGILVLQGTFLCAMWLRVSRAALYTNDWAVRIRAGEEAAKRIAEKHGLANLGQIGHLKSYYGFRHRETAKRSAESNGDVTVGIAEEAEVEWLQQQVVQRRAKRFPRVLQVYSTSTKTQTPARPWASHQDDSKLNRLWPCRDGSRGCTPPLNIAGAWRRGYTGKGVVVSVLEDGIAQRHPALEPNYDQLASFNVSGQDGGPSPGYSSSAPNFHGTQCAGTVAAAANTSRCTVGVAFRARIGGIRMLDGDVTDMVEAGALSFRPHYVDVYLATWGPEDDGATLGGPGPLTLLALQNGVETGRRGRGSIFVWASGNGGRRGDHCSCDGYGGSIYTVSVSSSTPRGRQPDDLERCASILTTASTGGGTEGTVTLGPHQSCSRVESDTSLSAAMAAGVIALTLEANPSLTWRDVQHIIVRTSRPDGLLAPDWHANGGGFKVSHLYGFGLLDAESMVMEAERWDQVPPQHECVEEAPLPSSRTIHPGLGLTSVYESSGCSDQPGRHVAYAEHVVVRVTIAHSRRGDLSIRLTSPSGTVSQLLAPRPHDDSAEGFNKWEFMSTHCWGERAAGAWTLQIQDTPSQKRERAELGALKEWSLVIYGTAEPPYPAHVERVRSAERQVEDDLVQEYDGPCNPECSDSGCEGPGPRRCITCLRFFLKFKNNTRVCVSECPRGFWGDRRRCKKCYSSCERCSGSRSDQCTSCQEGHHLVEDTSTCTAVCGDGYYLDHDANVCRKCDESCLTCTSSSICTRCKPNTSLQGNRCQQSCTPGFYHESGEGVCKPCDRACATCAGAGFEACDRCAEGYLMQEWRCVASCGAGFYATESNPEIADGLGMCRRCDASCLTCVGPSWGNCSSCSGDHSLLDGVCVVNTRCTEGQFQDADGKCHACDATCLRCKGPRRDDCFGCDPSRALDDSRCVTECARGKYRSGGRCHLCDHTCATCVDAGPANCTSCDTDKFGVERYLHGGRCVDACPEAFYHTAGRSCERCSDHCRLCSGAGRCLGCDSSYYVSGGACAKLECGEGEVEDPDYDDCMACEEGCRKCILYNPRHCLSCTEGFYNFQDGCYKNCPAKTYSVDEDMTCVPCDENCVSCDEHECYWCETDLFLSEGTCVSVCPDGFYGDEDTNDCEECHADCTRCDGPEDGDCLSCEDGKPPEDGRCVSDHEDCPVKTFSGDDGGCEDCHPSCGSCSGGDKHQCTKCEKGRFLTAQQTCVSKCPAGFFASRVTSACEACPPGCAQCVDSRGCVRCQSAREAQLFLQDGRCVSECAGGYPDGQVCRGCAAGCSSCGKNATHCLSCEEPLLLDQHRCVEECPPGHTAQERVCRPCPSACRGCLPAGPCTDCEEYHFLHEGLCVPDCPEGFFKSKEQMECLRCHANCALCTGPGSDDCSACVDPEATLNHGECVQSCPAHHYTDSLTGECAECDDSCMTCAGPHADACTSCRQHHRLDGLGRCVRPASACSPHQYADQDGECHPCHKYCGGCWGPGTSHCLSCTQRHLLLNGTCVAECPAGYYGDESEQKCGACHRSCQSCVGASSHQCLICAARLFREGKQCVETCQPGHYGNAGSRLCERCDPSCAECVGGREDSCRSCTPGLFFLQEEGRCLLSCPRGYYHPSGGRSCESCHASCRTCTGRDARSCDSCHTGYFLSDGLCESMCSLGQYPLTKGSVHVCEDCHSSCLDCWGPGPSNCTMCPTQAILEARGRCLLCCLHGNEEAGHEGTAPQRECCNCTETRGECVVTTNVAFWNEEKEEVRGNLVVFIIASVLLALGLLAVAFLVKHSRSKSAPSDIRPRGYEKLGSGRYGGHGSASYSGHAGSPGSRFQEAQLVDIGIKEEEDDEDEDIVYMGRDGTVYRKFRYGQLGEENEDELEYDDESYAFR